MEEMQETQVQSLGSEEPLEKGMATHSSILAWRIPWTEEPGELQSIRSRRVRCDWSNLAHARMLKNKQTKKPTREMSWEALVEKKTEWGVRLESGELG